jgi:threonine synthase
MAYSPYWPEAAPFGNRRGSFWAFEARLPLGDGDPHVSLGEGSTPLIRSLKVGAQLGLPSLYFKNEAVNPTLSFKDRYAAVTVSMAVRLGFKKVVVSSTGNLGAAVAAYTAAAGLVCVVLCARHAPAAIIEEIMRYGALPVRIEGVDRFALVEHLAVHRGWYPAALFLEAPVHNPYGVEAYKTIAYELVQDLGDSPDVVVFPCARGNGLYGAWKGFKELAEAGVVQRLPRMVACQPAAANSLEQSVAKGDIVRIAPSVSIAASITEEIADRHAFDAIRASAGVAVSVSEAAIADAVRQLGAEGIWVEPSSAATVAALPLLLERGAIRRSDTIVAVLTGSGAKWAGIVGWDADGIDRIEGRPEELESCLHNHGITP